MAVGLRVAGQSFEFFEFVKVALSVGAGHCFSGECDGGRSALFLVEFGHVHEK